VLAAVFANAQRIVPAGRTMQRAESNLARKMSMLYTVAVVLVILWLLGLVTSYTLGGLIHILLVIAVIVILLRVISGRSPL
jgi:predicted ferric reductase